ncbi:MAG: hypothetical protein JXB07_21695 [Anaerolineae bacterium]|nr:hypothetical protein [Anaerolineae bacterium]
MQIIEKRYPVDILTANYRISGELRPLGNPTVYLNDASRTTLTIFDAMVVSLRPGIQMEPMAATALYVPKKELHVLILGKLTLEEIKPLPKVARIVCLTETYLLHGDFHMGMDTKVVDVFSMLAGPFFFASNIRITSLYTDAVSVHAAAGLAYVHHEAIKAFYVPDEEDSEISTQ